jgi:hypothetical protein
MAHGGFLGAAVVLFALGFQIYVTYRIWRCRLFERVQKVAQSRLVWFLPVIGAAIVFSVLVDEERTARSEGGPYSGIDAERRSNSAD